MAAPCGAWRVMQLRHVFHQLRLHPGVVAGQLQQIRLVNRGPARVKPKREGTKEKIISQKVQKVQTKVMSKGWYEKVLPRVPVDDVWMRRFYGRPKYKIEDVLTMHKELAQPCMLDNTDGFIYLYCELDFTARKKTKFMSAARKTVVLPHNFDDGTENRVVAFCKTQEEKEAALAAGATFAGGVDIVKSIEKGEIHHEDYDHVVCTNEMVVDIAKIRKPLRDHFPVKTKGNLGPDIVPMVEHFVKSKTFETVKIEDKLGKVCVRFGQMSQPLEHLVANYNSYIDSICAMKPYGRFIESAVVLCPPSPERLAVVDEQLLPVSQREAAVAAAAAAAEEKDDDAQPPSAAADDADEDSDEDEPVKSKKRG